MLPKRNAMIDFLLGDYGERDMWQLWMLAVLPECQRSGIGGEMMKMIEDKVSLRC